MTLAGAASLADPAQIILKQEEALIRRLCDGENLRSGIVVVVDTEAARLGLSQPVGEASEVHFLPAIGGGEPRTK